MDVDAAGRFCGIDHGEKRIGLAISDPEGTIASPLATLEVRGGLDSQVDSIVEATADEEVAQWVVGLPLNMDGTEGPQAKVVRKFAERLGQISGKPVHLADERLSSRLADEYLQPAELTRKKHKARRDRVAAQIILQTFLDARRRDED
jgi:putative Holliday junction resolvase